jgi:hypothetical protein
MRKHGSGYNEEKTTLKRAEFSLKEEEAKE